MAKLAGAGHSGHASVVLWPQNGQGARARRGTPSGALCRATRAVQWELAMARRLCTTAAHRRRFPRCRGDLRAVGASARERGSWWCSPGSGFGWSRGTAMPTAGSGGGDTAELGVLGAGTFLRALELRKTSCGGAVEQHKRSGRPMVRRRRGIEQRTELTGEEVGSRFRRSTGLRSRQRDQVVSLAYGGSTAGLVVARGAAGRREHGGAGVLRGGAEAWRG